ncbi:hypothetical protein BB560_003236 [Smittium megazygosporum]|uniref:5'-Nucleotidase C-terminal domain-containing protein n=1 Tax=Smittium megazygosporum TaxID=133381 RepID=A0A2T9ZCI4_9FUNG|nr:hypothetical protein BB560_003236 [Smittium megazygosporum]
MLPNNNNEPSNTNSNIYASQHIDENDYFVVDNPSFNNRNSYDVVSANSYFDVDSASGRNYDSNLASFEYDNYELSEFGNNGRYSGYSDGPLPTADLQFDNSALYWNLKNKKFYTRSGSLYKIIFGALFLIVSFILYTAISNNNSTQNPQPINTELDAFRYNVDQLKKIKLSEQETFLRIIHTNDIHSKIDSFSDFSEGLSCVLSNSKNISACFGGMARLKTAIDVLKENFTELSQNYGSVLLDAGDQFQGGYYFNFFGPQAIGEIVKSFGYDAMQIPHYLIQTLGNHEFDEGPSVLKDYLENINITVVSSNLYIQKDKHPELFNMIKPFKVIKKYNLGIIGVSTKTTKYSSSTGPYIDFFDNIASINESIEKLHTLGIKNIILLSHLGYDVDVNLATQINQGVSVVIGGHTHSFLYSGNDTQSIGESEIKGEYPTVIDNKGWKTYVVQAKAWGEYIGILDIVFDGNGKLVEKYTKGSPIRISPQFKEDVPTKKKIEKYQNVISEKLNTEIGKVSGEVTLANKLMEYPHNNKNLLRGESPMGNLVTSAISDYLDNKNPSLNVDFSLVNSGLVKKGFNSGPILVKDLLSSIPYNNTISYIDIKGSAFHEVLDSVLRGHRNKDPIYSFVYLDNVRFNWTVSTEGSNNKELVLDKVYIKKKSSSLSDTDTDTNLTSKLRRVENTKKKINLSDWELLDLNKVYRLASITFILEGGDQIFVKNSFEYLQPNPDSNSNNNTTQHTDIPVPVNETLYSMIEMYFKKNPEILPIADGRCGSDPLF